MQINQIIEKAKEEHKNQLLYMNQRLKISVDDFKSLFIIRAQQAMADRKNFSQFVIDDNNRTTINKLFFWLTRQESGMNNEIGIVLNGAYGCGKSVLIEAFCMVLNDLTPIPSGKITFIHAIELASQIQKVGVIPYARIPLLIQDLGKEEKTVKDFGTTINPISDLLALRAEYGSMTFGSTNMDKKGFQEAYKEYISKRIWEHVNLIYLPGRSRRQDWTIDQPT